MKRPKFLLVAGSEPVRRASRIALRLALGLIALWAVYLALANVALSTRLVRHFANASPDVRVEYARAWSWWPGRLHVQKLVVYIQDYNVQARLAIDEGQFELSLHELAVRRFHATRVRAQGTSFQMRHKVHAVGKNAARLAKYPRIEGFSDPPLYVGPPPPPIPDDQYALWEVKLDDVVATAKELWILEYRYRGSAVATGSFDLRPARFFRLNPSRLEFDHGTLSVGDDRVAERVALVIGCRVEGHDIRTVEGLAIFRKISAALHGTFERGGLGFMNVYFEPNLGAHITGGANWKIDADIDAGRVRAGSRIELHASRVELTTAKLGGGGDVEVTLRAPDARSLTLEAQAFELRATSPAVSTSLPPPRARNVAASLTIVPSDLAGEPSARGGSLAVAAFHVPALAWFDALLPQGDRKMRIGGAASGSVRVEQADGKGLDGRAGVDLDDAWFQRGTLRVAATGSVRTELARKKASGVTLETLRVTLPEIRVADGDVRPLGFAAVLSAPALQVSSISPFALSGGVDVHAERIDSLLALLIEPAWLRRLTANTLDLHSLDGHAELNIGKELRRVDVRRARSGKLAIRGHIDAAGAHPRGAFLLSAGNANVGIEIRGGTTHTSILVGDDWLARGHR